MASILKIQTDYPCQVYIDYKLKGNASSNQLLKIPLKKGKYVLGLKIFDYLLYEQEYTMQTNDEEDLVRINIDQEVKDRANDICFWKISSMDVSVKVDNEHGLCAGKGLYFVNNITGEEYIVDCYRKDFSNYLDDIDVQYGDWIKVDGEEVRQMFNKTGLMKLTVELGYNTAHKEYHINKIGQPVNSLLYNILM